MKKNVKLKINGESPRSLFLAFVLAKLKFEVYIYNFLNNSNSTKDYQIFLFSKHSKNIFSKFDIWEEIEEISYGFDSLCIKDNLISEQLLFYTKDFSKKCLNNIGWTANYSVIKSLLINKLINSNYVHFISNKQLIDESLIIDYEFNFKSFNKSRNLFKLPMSNFKRKDKQILIFNVYLRGHVEKRLYEINTTKGLLILTPINNNQYQVIWNNVSLQIKENSLRSKSLFLDNLSTLLPNGLKVDEIISDIKILYDKDFYSNYLIRNKSINFNENKFNSNTIYDINFANVVIYILKIYYLFEKKETRYFKILSKFGFYYLLRNFIEIIINFSISNVLLHLFTVNNIFSLFFRKLLFNLFKRINLLKILIMKNFNISHNIHSLK